MPEIKQYANVKVEQIINVSSPDITLQNWITLANRINGIFAGDRKVADIVITHGTSTLEETAYFLNLTVKDDRPVVLVGAQRPATAISADGPLNLLNAEAAAVVTRPLHARPGAVQSNRQRPCRRAGSVRQHGHDPRRHTQSPEGAHSPHARDHEDERSQRDQADVLGVLR